MRLEAWILAYYWEPLSLKGKTLVKFYCYMFRCCINLCKKIPIHSIMWLWFKVLLLPSLNWQVFKQNTFSWVFGLILSTNWLESYIGNAKVYSFLYSFGRLLSLSIVVLTLVKEVEFPSQIPKVNQACLFTIY